MSTSAAGGEGITGEASSSVQDITDIESRDFGNANDATLLQDDFLDDGPQNTLVITMCKAICTDKLL
jgi:hypothetical protein